MSLKRLVEGRSELKSKLWTHHIYNVSGERPACGLQIPAGIVRQMENSAHVIHEDVWRGYFFERPTVHSSLAGRRGSSARPALPEPGWTAGFSPSCIRFG